MARTRRARSVVYDRVYVWDPLAARWNGRTVANRAAGEALRDSFLRVGVPAVIGASTIGAPEGPPGAYDRKRGAR